MHSLKNLIYSIFVFIIVVINVTAQDTKINTSPVDKNPIDLTKYKLHSIYSNDFSKPQKIVFEEDLIEQTSDGNWKRKSKPDKQAVWIAEGQGGAEIRDGKLRVAPTPFDAAGQPKQQVRSHLVIWNNRIFPTDFLLEFDMNPNNSTGGLTIVFICAAGKNGEDIFDLSLPPRRADYKTYHSGEINNYSDSYWSRNTETESLTNRLRKNSGFKLVAEGQSLTTGATNLTHHVRILKFGAHIEVEINGKVIFKWNDAEKALGAGRIGLRSMEGVTMITYDNFKVWQISEKKH